MLAALANLLALLVLPFVLAGVIQRTKALWAGRRGPPILQTFFDARRLLQKRPVYAANTTIVFRVAPYVLLLTALGSALLTPLLGQAPLASFPLDFVWFAYAWGLGRALAILAALDVGSSFEGMGAAREATFASLLEPVLFVVLGALCCQTGAYSLGDALLLPLTSGASLLVWGGALVALFVVLQVETARVPVDDPATHLELTMVHEVMVLDHSGPELAAIQLGNAVKLAVGATMLATLLNPLAGTPGPLTAAANVLLAVVVAIAVGSVESLVARLRLRAVPAYIAAALAVAAVALLATAWRQGGGR